MCEEMGITFKELNLLVCTSGPGSFTGLRVGMSALKGIALGGNIPLVSVPTMLITKGVNLLPKMKERFIAYVKQYNPDFILGTHFLISPLILPIIKECHLDLPVYGYAPDIFYYPIAGSSKELDRIYVTSTVGRDWCYHLGFTGEQVSLCPFPLKKSIEDYKPLGAKEAREKLGLKNCFTIMPSRYRRMKLSRLREMRFENRLFPKRM